MTFDDEFGSPGRRRRAARWAAAAGEGRARAEGEGPWRRGHRHGPFGRPGPGGRGFPEPGWLGPGFGWDGPRGRGRRARRGDVRAAALLLLAEEPRNGYQVIQEIAERSGQVWRPSPGSVYPVLAQLEDEGLVAVEGTGGGRRYALTDAGREYVRDNADKLGTPWEDAAGAVPEETWQLFALARQVFGAVAQVASAGSAAQQAEAARLLTDTRRALYRVLAEDETDPGQS